MVARDGIGVAPPGTPPLAADDVDAEPIASPPTRSARHDGALAAAILVVAVVVRLPTLAFPLTESHAFRQTQTAFTAVLYAREGIDLLHPPVPIFGPPWTLPFEFPLFQAIAALLIGVGVDTEIALRGLSLACFVATAVVLWLILHRHVNARTALIGLLTFSFAPLALLWSRTSMIEYLALLAALLFMLGTLEWHAGRGMRWFALAIVAGPVAALVKLTTSVFWVAPALLTRRWQALALCAIPALVGMAWNVHADAVKAASPWTESMTSTALSSWTLGGDRLSLDLWRAALASTTLWAGILLIPFAPLVIARRERLVWAWFAIALIGPIILFFHLYAVHDYYTVAVSPSVAALVAGGIDLLLTRVRRPRLVGGLILTTAVTVILLMSDYWISAYTGTDPEGVLEAAAILRDASPGGQPVELGCEDWSPAVMFYADRRGFVLDGDGRFLVIDDPRVC